MSKYRNVRQKYDGRTWDSKKELAYYIALKEQLKQGKIKDLIIQPEFVLMQGYRSIHTGRWVRPIKYRADFQFYDVEQGRTRVIDVKGFRTQIYRIKEKLFGSVYPDIELETV